MDPNRWPVLVWLFVALVFGSLVISFGLLIWTAAFRRQKPRWILDTLLLGFSGLILVVVVMIFVTSTAGRFAIGPQRLIGEFIMVSAGLVLVWVSRRILYRRAEARRRLGSAHGEFRVPHDFDDPLPKDIEDDFYKGSPNGSAFQKSAVIRVNPWPRSLCFES